MKQTKRHAEHGPLTDHKREKGCKCGARFEDRYALRRHLRRTGVLS